MESSLVRADMVEAIDFPHLTHKYNVRGVPRTVINESFFIEGAVPEQDFVAEVMKAASPK
jgi:predicted DsbA family dithiol-disulfide isomerase